MAIVTIPNGEIIIGGVIGGADAVPSSHTGGVMVIGSPFAALSAKSLLEARHRKVPGFFVERHPPLGIKNVRAQGGPLSVPT